MPTQAPEIDGVCLINDFGRVEPRPGEIRRLRITGAHDYDLVGELVDEPADQGMPARPASAFRILNSPDSPATGYAP